MNDIVNAGGLLERNLPDDQTNYRHLVSIINRRLMAPDGQQVILHEWLKPGTVVLRLSGAAGDWRSGPLPERISKWHPAVADIRAERRLDHISASMRPRALRILQSLALEARARGHSVRASKRPHQYGYGEQTGGIVGCLVFEVGGIRCALSITEPQDRVAHVATAKEVEKTKRDTWYRIPSHDYVKSGRLHLTMATDSGYSDKVRWADKGVLKLESRLCDVMPLYERWAAVDAERKEAERQRQLAAQERRAQEDELARAAYTQQALADQLIADLNAWELVDRLRQYLGAMTHRVASITEVEERSAAVEWLRWCERYTAKQDPFAKPIRTPTIKPPGYSDVLEFRKRLGYGSAF
ncbi:hypothetical protein [Mycobacterium sp. E735]|uniref:hypothetical protein n=1 Tax=Mycobacterium sp. E735 TaxID=1834148 RepID=UPI001E48F06A|nr:hypothetical protein [Mycobacterium sp. E735]